MCSSIACALNVEIEVVFLVSLPPSPLTIPPAHPSLVSTSAMCMSSPPFPPVTHNSEGLSYWVVAEAASWFGHIAVRNRTFTEEHARDSFENLLFGLCR